MLLAFGVAVRVGVTVITRGVPVEVAVAGALGPPPVAGPPPVVAGPVPWVPPVPEEPLFDAALPPEADGWGSHGVTAPTAACVRCCCSPRRFALLPPEATPIAGPSAPGIAELAAPFAVLSARTPVSQLLLL